jgi:glycosyltransferase involved in cell wall biosynthesis
VDRLAASGGEHYYAQSYTVETVARLAGEVEDLTVLCLAAERYDRRLSNGVRSIGLPVSRVGEGPLISTLEQLAPTHLVLRTPSEGVMKWALRQEVRVLPLIADSFKPGLRRWLGHRKLARQLNEPRIEWVANHNINAARSLADLGVDPAKIIPWDYPILNRPEDRPVKRAPASRNSGRLIFVGTHRIDKGTGDAIQAISILRDQGLDVTLTSAGGGDVEAFRRMAHRLGVGAHVNFLGMVEHNRIVELMNQHDGVLVPSRHEYPEGLPLTIYDGLASRTPLVVSDHPMFQGRIVHGVSGLVHRAAHPADLARQVHHLLADRDLYARLSAAAPRTLRGIECPAKWDQVLEHWLKNEPEDRDWLRSHALDSNSDRQRREAHAWSLCAC